ncbi:amino acid transport protein [Acinetobacter sichuanensis]|uniref:Amino acid transport protein n=1 Tax=Acinetobacter sichuanensis TaxID=2136183 RepID=A0A371YSK3_9GAMM|nr:MULTISPECIES: amino acid transport protein [Acinetobacter]MDM1246400.1 amino acid transport protein [Acinetobacter sp. R933-2]MDM1762887.1 amino acid transport protein [Acinetobacter sp. 226-1]MDM1766366.1 amino acid transport protein [Acinetobacter sp. 226-4]MDQ9020712.1 amino acid transport protein [Acinetobacter sichuanensis]RFC84334.1 amino acid transport protein [Acinetobacter sichuanensis]
MNTTVLLLGVVFSSIGLGYFIFGKKQKNMVVLVSGIILMLYPYFIENIFFMLIIGVALIFLPKFIKI